MKKILIVLVICLVAVPCFAASTLVCTESETYFGGVKGKKVTCTATADGTAYTTLAISKACAGMYLYMVSVAPGGTAPTDNSDLEILEDSDTGLDVLGGIGLNMIDNATTNHFRPTVNSVAAAVPIYGTLYVKASGNIVASAIFVVTLKLVPHVP